MAYPIPESIKRRISTDILYEFKSLSSPVIKAQVFEQIIELIRLEHSDLNQHRYLLILARLLDELTSGRPGLDNSTLLNLLNRCSSLTGQAEITPTPLPPLQRLGTQISSDLRGLALRHLKAAILSSRRWSGTTAFDDMRLHSSLQNRSIRVSAPVRLDLGTGGVSDCPPFNLERYGNCISVPIRLNGCLPVEVKAEVLSRSILKFSSRDLAISRSGSDISDFETLPPELRLHKEIYKFFIMQVLGLHTTEEFYSKFNAGLHLETYSRLPVGSGLGASSMLLCAAMKALGGLFDINLTPPALFSANVYLENVISTSGGWEDASAIFPGVNMMESFPDNPLCPRSTPISVSTEGVRTLMRHLVLIDTGITRLGKDFFNDVIERYCLGDTHTHQAIEYNNALNREIALAVSDGDLRSIGQLMESQWSNWKRISYGQCSNPSIDHLLSEAAPYVYGGRMNGAGRGGCAMFIVREGSKEGLRRTLRVHLGNQVRFYKWEPIY